MTKKALAVVKPQAKKFTESQIELIKTSVMPAETTDDEFKVFLHQCERTMLDPFNRQIYPIKRWNSNKNRNVISPETSIDGFRVIAERSGKYAGQGAPMWCASTGLWRDVWLSKEQPAAAKILVYRTDFKEPITAVATWESYCKYKEDGTEFNTWKSMGDIMLSKCAEALALRKAFPQDLSGLYTSDEMGTAESQKEKVEVKESTPVNKTPEQKPENNNYDPKAPVKKQQLDLLTNAMKKTEWRANDVSEISKLLFEITESKKLNQEQFKQIFDIVYKFNPQDGCQEALMIKENEKTP